MDFVSFSKIHFLIKSFPIPFSTGPQSIMVLEFFCGHFHIRSGIIVTVYSSPQAPFSNLPPHGSVLVLLSTKAINPCTLHVPYARAVFNNSNDTI